MADRCCVFVLFSSNILIKFADIIMVEAKKSVRRLRSESTHFFGLKEEDNLPPGGLPTNKNVLKVILKQKTSDKKTPVEKLVCCSLLLSGQNFQYQMWCLRRM